MVNRACNLNKWGKPYYEKIKTEVPWVFHNWKERYRGGFWLNPYNHQKIYVENKGDAPKPVIRYILISTTPKADIKYKEPMKIKIRNVELETNKKNY